MMVQAWVHFVIKIKLNWSFLIDSNTQLLEIEIFKIIMKFFKQF